MEAVRAEHLMKRYVLTRGKRGFMAPRIIPNRLRRWETTTKKRARPPREVIALKDVSFSIEPGTILGIIGANGAGKTTLLKILARITLPTAGHAQVVGRLVSLLELGSGFQPESTGRENIYLNAAMLGIPASLVERRLDDIIEFADIGDFLDVPMKRFSSGMFLRLAFSVAINLEPDILLADEVLAVGDIEFQERCLRRVEQAGSEGLTVLFVSHDMAAVRRLCDKVIWLDKGRIAQEGKPDQVVNAYEEAALSVFGTESKDGSESGDFGEILETRLVSEDGSELGAARVQDDFYIEVVFKTTVPGCRVRCVLAVFVDQVAAFRTPQPDYVRFKRPGIYSARVRIPAHLLADVTYAVKVGVEMSKGGVDSNLVKYDALVFQVYDADEKRSARASYTKGLAGVVRPRLDWEVEHEPMVSRGRRLRAVASGEAPE
jgi:homopolymeric O-antigen transport system ATP-binding protein